MGAKLLERKPVSLESSVDTALFSFDGLADEAAVLLGYKALKDHIVRTREQAACEKKALPFKQVLAELDIKPFTKEGVEKYKKQTADRVEWAANHIGLRASIYACMVCACMVALMLVVFPVVDLILGLPDGSWQVFWGLALSSLIAFVSIMGFGEAYGWPKATWRRIQLSSYGKLIPEFALDTAVNIKKAYPQANYYVEELSVDHITKDPFLVVVDAEDNAYYVEVWNEPNFKQERQE